MCLNSYLRGVAKAQAKVQPCRLPGAVACVFPQQTDLCGSPAAPTTQPPQLPLLLGSRRAARTRVLLKKQPWKASQSSIFFLNWVGEKVFFFQFCHYFNSQSMWSNGSGNWGCWLGALTAARRGTYCSPSPDVVQGQLDGETCLNLTVIPLTLWGKSARRCCWMSQQKS